VFPQGKLEFPPPRVARLSLQNFPTSVRYGRQSLLSICRPLDGFSSMKFCSQASRFIRPFSSVQPIVIAAACGSSLVGALFLKGSMAGVIS